MSLRLSVAGSAVILASLILVATAQSSFAHTALKQSTTAPDGYLNPAFIPANETPAGKVESKIVVVATDLQGHPTSKYTLVQIAKGPDRETGNKALRSTLLSDEERLSTSSYPAGCREVTGTVTKYSLLGFVIFKFNQWKRWCYKNGNVTFWKTSSYVSKASTVVDYKGVVGSRSFYWNDRFGHTTYRQGKVFLCAPLRGCYATLYPWVKVVTTAGGNWYIHKGV